MKTKKEKKEKTEKEMTMRNDTYQAIRYEQSVFRIDSIYNHRIELCRPDLPWIED